MVDPKQIRQAVFDAIPADTSEYGRNDVSRKPYFPPAHIKALTLSSNLVMGARGVGKSFWTHALADPKLKKLMSQTIPELDIVDVKIGFANKPLNESYPDKNTIKQLLSNNYQAYDIWRAVVARWLRSEVPNVNFPTHDWDATIQWVAKSPEAMAKLLESADRAFADKKRKGLIVFDALDYTSDNWDDMNLLVRDLLRLTLELKPFVNLYAKIFLRPDQLERVVTNFPDASKLFQNKTDLDWEAKDLHGLLWHTLCNAADENGQIFRQIYATVTQKNSDMTQIENVWDLHGDIKRNDAKLKALFEQLAGAWMGRDRRRGVPYIWTIGHLADGKRKTSPRSFLAAIRTAAQKTADDHPDHTLPLHYDAIKKGVQTASGIRVREMTEDYPWVDKLMQPLSGLNVPNDIQAFFDKWGDTFGEKDIFDNMLPPPHKSEGWLGILGDLETLGIIDVTKDDRINLPDLYRVGYGLGRYGGVKPVK